MIHGFGLARISSCGTLVAMKKSYLALILGWIVVSLYFLTGIGFELFRYPGVAAWALLTLSVQLYLARGIRVEPLFYPALFQTRLRDSRFWLVVVTLSAPILFQIAATWSDEFPFSGDHDHHTFAVAAVFKFWQTAWWMVFLWLGLTWYGTSGKQGQWPNWWSAILGLAVLAALGLNFPELEYFFARYPSLHYTLAAPIAWFAEWRHWPNLVNVGHLVNSMALPLGYLVLRVLLGFGPIRLIHALFVIFVFWQKDVIYYMGSSYLEPWALAFLGLSFEAALTPLNQERRWLAPVLVGVASLFKEQSILFFPSLWFISYRKDFKNWREALAAGLMAAPFVTYYLWRKERKIWREVTTMDFDHTFSASRVHEWGVRAMAQLGVPGLIMVAFALGILFYFCSRSAKGILVAMLVAVFGPILFFFFDGGSAPWTGYPRFHLMSWLVLGSAVFVVPDSFAQKKKVFGSALFVLVLLQGIGFAHQLKRELGPSLERSFSEHYDSPQYYPIREIINLAKSRHLIYEGSTILLDLPTSQFNPAGIGIGYRDLLQSFRFGLMKIPSCACQSDATATLILIPSLKNWAEGSKTLGDLVDRRRLCAEQLKASCRDSISVIDREGHIAAMLGVRK